MIVAIDGPAGSGKGTIASRIAHKYNLLYIDTGAVYRCLALTALRNNIQLLDINEIIELSNSLNVKLSPDGKVFLDGEDVTTLIRSKEVTSLVSPISNTKEVRENIVRILRSMALNQDVVLEGRDITTVVFPNADYKFYLDASLDTRAKRRFIENQKKGIDMSYEEIYENIKSRDYNDMNKPIGALKRTNDQVYIDSTNLTIDEVVDQFIEVIEGGEKHES